MNRVQGIRSRWEDEEQSLVKNLILRFLSHLFLCFSLWIDRYSYLMKLSMHKLFWSWYFGSSNLFYQLESQSEKLNFRTSWHVELQHRDWSRIKFQAIRLKFQYSDSSISRNLFHPAGSNPGSIISLIPAVQFSFLLQTFRPNTKESASNFQYENDEPQGIDLAS